MTYVESAANDCDRCGWPVGQGTRHDANDEEGISREGVCIVRMIDTEQTLGWKRRRQPVRKMYK